MPQALKPLSLIQFGSCKNFPFPIISLWGNKNWLPSMKVKKFENVESETGLKGCKWSSLDAPGTETPLSLIHIGSWKNSPVSLLALWGNKIGLHSMKMKELEKLQNKMGLKGCK